MTRYASAARTDDVFTRARTKVSIEDYVKSHSSKLAKSGNELRGPCILCDKSGSTKFRVKGDRWNCFGCDLHGDVCDLVAEHRRVTPYDAARWLLGEDVPVSAPRERSAPAEREGPSVSELVAREILAEAKPFQNSLAERYLIGRGIAPGIVMLAAPNLRYHAAAKHHWDDGLRRWVCAPAMVAQVVVAGPDGEPIPTGGVHCTYLDRASGGKSALERTKLMWGPQYLGEKPGGAWLIGPGVPEVGSTHNLVVAEGIETSLSVATLGWRKGLTMRACAALALNRLQGGVVRDEDGCIEPWRPVGDPARPAFTWPTPAADPWAEVLVAVDRDMADQRAKVRTGRGKPIDQLLTAEVRARMCGRLAVAAWKSAGAPTARAIAPPPGLDFNDDLRRVLARECDA